MPNVKVERGEIIEDMDFFVLWRVVGANGAVLVQADVTSYDVVIFDMASETPYTAVYSSLAQPASDIVFNSLQTDGFWHPDRLGYNVRYQVRAANISGGMRGGRKLRVCITLNCAAGSFAPHGWGAIVRIAEVSMLSRVAA